MRDAALSCKSRLSGSRGSERVQVPARLLHAFGPRVTLRLRASLAGVAGRHASLVDALLSHFDSLFCGLCAGVIRAPGPFGPGPSRFRPASFSSFLFPGSFVWASTHARASYVHATKHLADVPIRGRAPNKVKDGQWRGGGSPLLKPSGGVAIWCFQPF